MLFTIPGGCALFYQERVSVWHNQCHLPTSKPIMKPYVILARSFSRYSKVLHKPRTTGIPWHTIYWGHVPKKNENVKNRELKGVKSHFDSMFENEWTRETWIKGITSLWDRGGRTNDCEVAKDKPVPNLVTRTSPHHPTDYSTVAPAGAASTASVEVESPISDVFNKSMSDSSWYMSSSNPDTWKKVRHQASIAQLEVEQSLFAFAPSNHKKEPFACHDVFTPSPARIF